MARQHVHNRRAGRGGGGSYWISYSDIMAALVLVFVLFLTLNLYRYNELVQTRQQELDTLRLQLDQKEAQLVSVQIQLSAKQAELNEKAGLLIIQQGQLEIKDQELSQLRLDLDAKQAELDQQNMILLANQQALANQRQELVALQTQLARQQSQFAAKTRELNTMVGIRSEIVAELSAALQANNLSATIDANGNITLESTVMFQTGSYEISEAGQALLRRFLPVYLSVLLRPEYSDYLGEIIIEGHTDSSGDYIKNLRLSQNRALAVSISCLNMVTGQQRATLERILTAKGRSSSDLVYYSDGVTENKDASRRVEFKFSLRDAEMIDEMNAILQQTSDYALEVMP
ncbi:MAG: OmpA family protein [Clostridia bacterium]|nr:OmpA family protein [Clostridia bacterium]